jgi:predicted DNA-binding transcriptional regulator AlpA
MTQAKPTLTPTDEGISLLREIRDRLGEAPPEGLDAAAAARLIGISVSKFRAMDAAGEVPAPVQIGTGRCPRWLRSELLAWLRAGAPSRLRWAQMREVLLKRAG